MALTPDTSPLNAQRLYNAGRLPEAAAAYSAIVRANPRNASALMMLGTIHLQLGDFAEGVRLLDASIAIDSNQPVAHNNRGIALSELKRYDDGVRAYDRAIALDRQYAEAYSNRGNALRLAKRYDDALRSYDRALMLKPDLLGARTNRGEALIGLGKFAEAIESCDQDIALNPNFADAYNTRGNAHRDQGDIEAALTDYNRAIAVRPAFAEARYNRGNIFILLQRWDEAMEDLRAAIALRPNYADAYNALGRLLYDLGSAEEALGYVDHALALNPSMAETHNYRGNILTLLKRFDEALNSFDRSIVLYPEYPYPHANKGVILKALGRHKEALAAFNHALELDPSLEMCLGDRVHTKLFLCDWRDFEPDVALIAEKIDADIAVALPWYCLPMPLGAARERKAMEAYARKQFLRTFERPAAAARAGGKIRIGYFSADFHDHATALLMAGMIEAHDRARFDVIGFAFGPPRQDRVRQRLIEGFDEFYDVGARSDEDIVAQARLLNLDIAIDLKGHTQDARPNLFARGVAPIQASFLGFPGTMGVDFIDYLIADPILIPPEHRDFYSEKIVYLPDTYQVNDSKRAPAAAGGEARAAHGLPETGFVFCSFNSNYKITPDLFAIWMRLLTQVEGSVLWVYEGNADAGANLRAEAEKHGVAGERLVFAPRVELAAHLARHAHGDLFLDTFYCNAHTTASDALWAGLPVLARLGNTFSGRVAASLLSAVGLPELIAPDAAAYEAMALDLAQHPEKLAALKAKLAAHRSTHPLFDTVRFTRHIERAYERMHARAQSGEAPDHIVVEPLARG